MRVLWTDLAREDYVSHDQATRDRINELISSIKSTPFKGLGKPEPLKHDLQGWWSRRINREDRLVYRVSGKGAGRQLRSPSADFTTKNRGAARAAGYWAFVRVRNSRLTTSSRPQAK